MPTIDKDTRYFQQRLVEERERIAGAACKEAEVAHRGMALLYRQNLLRADDASRRARDGADE